MNSCGHQGTNYNTDTGISAGDTRSVITRTRLKQSWGVGKTARLIQCTDTKATLSGVKITLLDHTPCSFKECDFPHTTIFQTTSTDVNRPTCDTVTRHEGWQYVVPELEHMVARQPSDWRSVTSTQQVYENKQNIHNPLIARNQNKIKNVTHRNNGINKMK